MVKFWLVAFSLLFLCTIFSCRERTPTAIAEVQFTKEDSLTDRYLILQDSLLQAWNLLVNDDNQKLKDAHHLLHELSKGKQAEEQILAVLSHRLEQLQRIRFTQKTMANPDVIEEYDFASASLLTELLTLASTSPHYEQNPVLQSLVTDIRMAEERIGLLRENYDHAAHRYNGFLQHHRAIMKSIDENCTLERKAIFEMASH
jgi:hypothetical protein